MGWLRGGSKPRYLVLDSRLEPSAQLPEPITSEQASRRVDDLARTHGSFVDVDVDGWVKFQGLSALNSLAVGLLIGSDPTRVPHAGRLLGAANDLAAEYVMQMTALQSFMNWPGTWSAVQLASLKGDFRSSGEFFLLAPPVRVIRALVSHNVACMGVEINAPRSMGIDIATTAEQWLDEIPRRWRPPGWDLVARAVKDDLRALRT